MQQNGEADGFFSIASSPVTFPSSVLIVDSKNANRFLQGSEASERVTHAGLRVVDPSRSDEKPVKITSGHTQTQL
jgi:hypothetical protein